MKNIGLKLVPLPLPMEETTEDATLDQILVFNEIQKHDKQSKLVLPFGG